MRRPRLDTPVLLVLVANVIPSGGAFAPRNAGLTCRGHTCPHTSFRRVSKSSMGSDGDSTTATTSSRGYDSDEAPLFQRFLPPFPAERSQPLVPAFGEPEGSLEESGLLPNSPSLVLGAGALALTGTVLAASLHAFPDLSLAELVAWGHRLVAHPQETLQAGVDAVRAMGPAGAVLFGLIYFVAEVLAVPATPLTLSAGYLFGVVQGAAIVLLAATAASSVAFVIGKTLLRGWVEETLARDPKLARLDRAIGREGFRLLLLVRLSPIFPFALSNYVYGASSIDFGSYFWGTLLGFAPGTVAYVYTGMVGQALTLGSSGGSSEPWYVYAGGFAALAAFLKVATDVASDIVEAIDQEEDD